MSCEHAKRVSGYWQRRDYGPSIYLSESRMLAYCENCLAHAQIILTEMLGEDETERALDSKHPMLMRLVTPNRSHADRWFWHPDLNRLWAGDR